MRTLAVMTLAVMATAVSSVAHAQGRYYPWCARHDPWVIVCGYDTYRQCMATVLGEGGICQQNVASPPVAPARAVKRKPRRYR
jgi:hypothetical protein